ncbi:MAG: hypothetical protein FWD82_08220 [Defluviitaleaceae bacterium]|nr:hypothetical protein [Defluviitaleaceae bacterium]
MEIKSYQNRSVEENYNTLDFQEFINIYYYEISDGWKQIQGYVNKAFEIESEEEYESFLKEFYIIKFDHKYMRKFYDKIKVKLSFFNDDILKYIAFIATLGYFKRVGKPSLTLWINADNQNRPYDKIEENGYKGNSLVSLLKYNNGMNAVRYRLLSAWNIVI